MEVIVAFGIYEHMGKWQYLLVTGGLATPLCLQPLLAPSLTGSLKYRRSSASCFFVVEMARRGTRAIARAALHEGECLDSHLLFFGLLILHLDG